MDSLIEAERQTAAAASPPPLGAYRTYQVTVSTVLGVAGLSDDKLAAGGVRRAGAAAVTAQQSVEPHSWTDLVVRRQAVMPGIVVPSQ